MESRGRQGRRERGERRGEIGRRRKESKVSVKEGVQEGLRWRKERKNVKFTLQTKYQIKHFNIHLYS